ncbi:MAG: hypothetical protein KGJ70_10040, partial [Gemmatimonadota bacterium]|nr:hypothetical protein [Gemmatimonadota bacterium]
MMLNESRPDRGARAAPAPGAVPPHRQWGLVATAALFVAGLLGIYGLPGGAPTANLAFVLAIAIAIGGASLIPRTGRGAPEARAEEPTQGHDALLGEIQRLEAAFRLSRSVAHDFSNVLTVIGMHGEFMLQGMGADDARRGDVTAILGAVDQGSTLSRQLLDFTRERAAAVGPLNLNDVVRSTSPMVERLVGRNIAIDLRLDPTIGVVLADAGQMRQLLVTLALNAGDARATGGVLTLATANAELDSTVELDGGPMTAGEYVVLAVSDTGRGMRAAVSSPTVEPFPATKRAGAAAGLTTARRIVRQNGGQLWVHHEPHVGTVIKIYLPLITGGRDGTDEPPATTRWTSGETILLIEDDEPTRAVARGMLQNAGYRVLGAPRGPAALAAASSCADDIALIVIDVPMPGAPGA